MTAPDALLARILDEGQARTRDEAVLAAEVRELRAKVRAVNLDWLALDTQAYIFETELRELRAKIGRLVEEWREEGVPPHPDLQLRLALGTL